MIEIMGQKVEFVFDKFGISQIVLDWLRAEVHMHVHLLIYDNCQL